MRDDELGDGLRHPYVWATTRGDRSTHTHVVEQHGVVAIDHQTTETLRIEAGRPLFGVDMDEDTIPLEAGIEDRAINFSKGCYGSGGDRPCDEPGARPGRAKTRRPAA